MERDERLGERKRRMEENDEKCFLDSKCPSSGSWNKLKLDGLSGKKGIVCPQVSVFGLQQKLKTEAFFSWKSSGSNSIKKEAVPSKSYCLGKLKKSLQKFVKSWMKRMHLDLFALLISSFAESGKHVKRQEISRHMIDVRYMQCIINYDQLSYWPLFSTREQTYLGMLSPMFCAGMGRLKTIDEKLNSIEVCLNKFNAHIIFLEDCHVPKPHSIFAVTSVIDSH